MKGKNKNYTTGGEGIVKAKKRIIDAIGVVRLKRIMNALLCFVLAAILAGTQLFPGTYPLGIALCASATGAGAALSTLAGVVVGSGRIAGVGGIYAMAAAVLTAARLGASVWLESGGVTESDEKRRSVGLLSRLKQLRRRIRESPSPGSIINALTAESKNYSGIMLRENYRIRLALSACAALLSGAWSVVEGGYVYYDLFGAVFSLLVTPVITYLFYCSRDRNMRASPICEVGVYVTAALIALSLHQMSRGALGELPGELLARLQFEMGVLFAFCAASSVTFCCGIHRGAMIGMLCGIVMEPIYAPMYLIAAVLCGIFAGYSRTFGLLCASVGATVWAVYVGGFDGFAVVFPPAVVACALLVPAVRFDLIRLPEGLLGEVGIHRRLSAEGAAVAELSARDMRRRINDLSDGLSSVSAVLGGMAQRLSKPGRAELTELVESSFDIYCSSCKNRERCNSASKSGKVASVIPKMAEELYATGTVSAAAVPASLASVCYNMGRILDEINLTAGKRIASIHEGDKLSVSAADYGLAGELFRHVAERSGEISSVDEELSRRLRTVLCSASFSASAVTVYGRRMKHIFVGDIDLGKTHLGGDDIRRLFEEAVGSPLSEPEFELDGASLSMRMHSVYSYGVKTGTYSVAASSVPMYCCDKRGCGADCTEASSARRHTGTEADETRISITDGEPEGVCGDSVTSFEADGRYYMIISDGMGSGKTAAVTSGIVTSLLERLIKAGAELECALKMLNSIIRSVDMECSATVDIAEIDLMTGAARFIKSGAAPSFVLRDGSIFRLQSKTVPIGILRALDAEMISFDIQPGDSVVMLSDGVARSYEEVPWLLDMMSNDQVLLSGDERSAAMAVVSEAVLRGSPDDISAGVLRVTSDAGSK